VSGTGGRSRECTVALCVALTLGSVIALAAPPDASAATTCSFDAGTAVLDVGGDPDVGTHLQVAATDEIRVDHVVANGTINVTCSGPTPTRTNTDTINVSHVAPDEFTQLRIIDPEEFGPGTIDEGVGAIDCPDEIEINVNLGSGDDLIRLSDSDGSDDSLVLGSEGIDWNTASLLCGDLDIDVQGSNVSYEITAGDGLDALSGQGSDFTGSTFGESIAYTGESGADDFMGGDGDDTADAGGGTDVLRGAGGNDRLTGGPGSGDRLFGQAGIDGLFAEDGKRDRRIDCGPGDNPDEFATLDRRKDPAAKSC
jgi:Ca2+-binding RTX toxin-like protein